MLELATKCCAYRLLLLQPHPLLVLQQERMPGLLHIKIATTHFESLSLLSRERVVNVVAWSQASTAYLRGTCLSWTQRLVDARTNLRVCHHLLLHFPPIRRLYRLGITSVSVFRPLSFGTISWRLDKPIHSIENRTPNRRDICQLPALFLLRHLCNYESRYW